MRFALSILFLFSSLEVLGETFRVERIDFQGLDRVDEGFALRLLNLRVSEPFAEEETPEVIESLYRSGYFEDVKLYRIGNRLLIKVQERPGIVGITIEGNKRIETDSLLEALARVDIATGKVLDYTALERMQEELLQQYGVQGRYGARVEAQTVKLSGNKVQITILINEGTLAAIKEIRVNGNHTVASDTILDALQSGVVSWYEFWSSRDNYSQLKLAADLETIRQIYLDLGYLDFKVTNTHVSLSLDRKHIRITIGVSEGGKYRVSGHELAGEKILPRQELEEVVHLPKGKFYSQKSAVASGKAIEQKLGLVGYAFAKVDVIPERDVEKGTVKVVLLIQPGRKTYVRRINFSGNSDTDDQVFRQEMRQLEGAVYSARKIKLSEARLRRLRFVEELRLEKLLVPGADEQIDLNLYLKERWSGSFNASVGFSSESGAILTFGIKQDNFLGTGKRVSLSFSNTDSTSAYGFLVHDPFYTIDGISRSLSFEFREVDYANRDTSASNSEEYSVGTNWGIPVSENDSFLVGAKIQDISVTANTRSPVEVRNFLDREGNNFFNYVLNFGFSYDTRDRAIFATDGGTFQASVSWYLPFSDLNYYKLNLSGKKYYPLYDSGFVLSMQGRASYGQEYGSTTEVPYYDRFYGGGASSLRGYRSNSLGPKDEFNDALGGDFRVLGNLDLYLPQDWFSDSKNTRFGFFVDTGNVYRKIEDFSSLSTLRGSTGVSMQWLTALGGLEISFAKSFWDEPGDRTETFQLDLGTSF